MRISLSSSVAYATFLASTLSVLAFAPLAHAAGNGVVTLTFDDGSATQAQYITPRLDANGYKGTFYINSALIGTDSYLTWPQLTTMQTTGHEIAGHTLHHIELPTVPLATAATEINDDYAALVSHGLSISDFATPFGAYDNPTLALMAHTYNSHRGFANIGLNTWPYNKYIIYVQYVTSATTQAQMQQWVQDAEAQDKWLVLVFHEILPTPPLSDPYSISTAQLDQFLAFLKTNNVNVKTIAGELQQTTNLVQNPSFETGTSSWTLDSSALTIDAGNHGNYPSPTHSLKILGSTTVSHAFGAQMPVTFGTTYGIRAYVDSQLYTSGEAGFFVDEYNAAGAWVSGKFLGSVISKNVVDRSFVYTPTSANVAKAAIQIYVNAATVGTIYIDNVELWARASTSTVPTPVPVPVPTPTPTPDPTPIPVPNPNPTPDPTPMPDPGTDNPTPTYHYPAREPRPARPAFPPRPARTR